MICSWFVKYFCASLFCSFSPLNSNTFYVIKVINNNIPCLQLWPPEASLTFYFLSSTLPEIDPDTAYVVCISVSLGFSYMVSIFPCFPDMVSAFPCTPYMVMLPTHLNVTAIVLNRALLWAAIDATLSKKPLLWRHDDKTVIVSRNTRGRERNTRQRIDNANARRLQTVNR